MRQSSLVFMCVVLSAIVALGCARSGRSSFRADDRAETDLARLRQVIRPYQSLDSAVAAGYPRDVADCFIHAEHGAMGYHHLNRAYLDNKADIDHPEILLYERLPDGRYRLNGVEFIVPYRFWPSDSTPPEVMGQRMKHENNMKYWYLHVWAATDNPDGVFADFNPNVQCPPGAKIYTPSPE